MVTDTGLSPAFLLHRRAYANTSLLIECFTPSQGRFAAIVNGVKGNKGRGAGLLQPFIPLLIRCSGRGEVKRLNVWEPAGGQEVLEGKALFCGFYLNELLMRLLQRDDPHPQLFSVYAETLTALGSGQPLEPLLRYFEADMLQQLGFGLVLNRDGVNGAPLDPDRRYHYLPESGPIPAGAGAPWITTGATLLALHRRRLLGEQQLREARSLSRYVLRHYLGDRPLKSRELFQSTTDRGQ
jgi:DNA repair protein RecO (recombination protein O)